MKRRVAMLTLLTVSALCCSTLLLACGTQRQAASDSPAEEFGEVVEEVAEDPADDQASGEDAEEGPNASQGDPADPPVAFGSYESDGETVEFYPMSCSSVWTFEQDGESMTVATDAPHPVQYSARGMVSAEVAAKTPVTVEFDDEATEATVSRWSEDELSAAATAAGSASDIDASSLPGETVGVEVADGKLAFDVEPGYRYAINATFDSGTAIYVFTAPAV